MTASNAAPACAGVPLTTAEDAPGDAAPSCTDADGDSLTYAIVGQPSHGTASIAAGQLHYVPAANYHGPDSFTYQANDGTIDSASATVTVTVSSVNDAPVAVADSYSTPKNTTKLVAGPGVLGNDTDADSDSLTALKVTDPSHGTVTLGSNGSISYVPTANYVGSDSFTYKANDGTADSNTVTVSLTVTASNAAPACAGVPLTTAEDTSADAAPSCTDADGDTLTYAIATQPSHGTASIAAGQLHYVPAANYHGPDSFTYQANDGTVDSASATVTVTVSSVNDAPACAGVPLTTAEDTSADAAPSCTDADGDTLTYAIATQPSHGTASIVAGQLHYVPTANYHGPDSFTYQANDGTVDSASATVTVTVSSVNDAPVAVADSYSTPKNTTKVVVAPGVLGNDTDADGDILAALKVTDPSHGTVTLNANGSLSYVPTTNYVGSDSFTYKANDGTADSNTVTVSLTVTASNAAPACAGVPLTTAEDTPGDAAPSCTDADGDTLTYAIVTQPSHGTASIVAGQLHYVPTANYHGPDSFTYQANDGTVDSASATVTVTVSSVNDAPACAGVPLTTAEDTSADAAPRAPMPTATR